MCNAIASVASETCTSHCEGFKIVCQTTIACELEHQVFHVDSELLDKDKYRIFGENPDHIANGQKRFHLELK